MRVIWNVSPSFIIRRFLTIASMLSTMTGAATLPLLYLTVTLKRFVIRNAAFRR